jgi:hypothetical protein
MGKVSAVGPTLIPILKIYPMMLRRMMIMSHLFCFESFW